jgi:HD superfamily phosphohydrolase
MKAPTKRLGKSPRRDLSSVVDKFNDEYRVTELLDSGGTGVVYKGHKAGDQDARVAIKFYVPPSQTSLFKETTLRSLVLPTDEKVFDAEFSFLKKTRHPGIQEIVSWGVLPEAGRYFPMDPTLGALGSNDSVKFIISKFIDGSAILPWLTLLVNAVRNRSLPHTEARKRIIRCILDITEILMYIHDDRKYQHSDIRSSNVLVQAVSNRPILIDFAYAHCFDLDALGRENQYTSIRYFPDDTPAPLVDDIKALIRKYQSNSIPREELKALIFPGLDLYHFGTLLRDICDLDGTSELLTVFDLDFLDLIVRRLTNWKSVRTGSASLYKEQLAKLSDGYWALSDSAKSYPSTEPIKRIGLPQASMWMSATVERIIETHAFRRLQLLNQLSLIHLVYPGATQTRFEHCLSVQVAAAELVHSLIKSPRFCLLFDSNSVQQLLLMALLHDINHFPFLHYFQEMKLEGLQSIDIVDLFCSGIATGDRVSLYDLMEDAGLSRTTLKNILFENHADIDKPIEQVIKSIVDSGADIDKMTYVYDDARATGVPFGAGIDRVALLHAADVGRFKPSKDGHADSFRYHLCFKPEAMSAVESLLFARYWNYKQIYWHHTNRAIGAMISHVIYRVFIEKTASFEEYLISGIGRDESGALGWLNSKYEQFYRQESIVKDLASSRDKIYKRLFSVRRLPDDERETKLFNDLESLDAGARASLAIEVSRLIGDLFKSALAGEHLRPEDVLLDIPGRPLAQEVGALHVCDLASDGSPTRELVSPFISRLKDQFGVLSKTIRFFISPTVRARIGKQRIASERVEIEKVIRQALQKIKSDRSQVR